jgi:2-phosphosulfolactate phosphatase
MVNGMDIRILHLLEGARQAQGLTVIIDVFRAFSVACYVMANGARELIPIGDINTAYQLKQEHPDYILIGERSGKIQPGFDFGNSPSQIVNADLHGKTVLHTTSAGTQGIVNAIHADEIITGSFVNAQAIIAYIQQQQPSEVSLVCMGWEGREPADEDQLFAEYVRDALQGQRNNFVRIVQYLREESKTGNFLDVRGEVSAPAEDFDYCLDLDRFSFVLKAEPREGGNTPTLRRIDIAVTVD